MAKVGLLMASSPYRAVMGAAISLRDCIHGARVASDTARLTRGDATENTPNVCYLSGSWPRDPLLNEEKLTGGAVKLSVLGRAFPHSFPTCSVLYRISSVAHRAAPAIVEAAKRAKIKIVTNQNGVVYPAWFRPSLLSGDASFYNARAARLITHSSFVVYQSAFCKEASAEFLGVSDIPSRIILNPVDTERFTPSSSPELGPPTIISMWGAGYRSGRTVSSLEAFVELVKGGSSARLRFIGVPAQDRATVTLQTLCLDVVKRAGIDPRLVEFSPVYSRSEAPALFRNASMMLHIAQNDPSPNVLGEALASGLPVVFQRSGGCEEIVGEAGVGLTVKRSWAEAIYPKPVDIAEGLKVALKRAPELSRLARARAVDTLSAQRFVEQHLEVFREIGG